MGDPRILSINARFLIAVFGEKAIFVNHVSLHIRGLHVNISFLWHLLSQNWVMGEFAGNHGFSHEICGFPVDFP